MSKQIETRKNELKIQTSIPQQMIHKYLSKRVVKTWTEEYADDNTGEVRSVERSSVLFEAGTLIDNDLQAQIMFHIQAGDIESVEVSNQSRKSFLSHYSYSTLYLVSAQISGNNKQQKFLLYATSLQMAHEIAIDFIELNYTGGFSITQIREFNSCVIIEDNNLKKLVDTEFGIKTIEEDSEEEDKKKYYKLEVNVNVNEEHYYPQCFIVKAQDADEAKQRINDWLKSRYDKEAIEKKEASPEVSTSIESATIISCSNTIDRDFSLAYIKAQEQ